MSKIKILSVLMAVAIAVPSVFAGCGSSSPAVSPATQESSVSQAQTPQSADGTPTGAREEDIEFTYFVPDPGAKVPPQDSPVMQQVYEATGVRLKYMLPPAEPEERLNMMLASGDLPDLINFDKLGNKVLSDNTLMKQFIQAGKIVKLNDLMEEYAPNTLHTNWKDLVKKIQDENGDLYYMPGYYSFADSPPLVDARYQFNVRTEYFDENGYDKYPKTFAEYEAILKEIKATTDMIPVSLAMGPQGELSYIIQVGAGAYDLSLPFGDKIILVGDKLQFFTQVPQMKEYFKFLNNLNVQGLVDPESPILSADMLKQKCVSGKVWSFPGWGWDINSEVIAYEMSNDSLAQMITLYPAADESIKHTSYAPYSTNLFTGGIAITTSCKDPERYMRFYEYINSEEGWLKCLGIGNFNYKTEEDAIGYDFIVRDDLEIIPGRKVIQFTDWMGEMWASDENWWWNHGINCLWDFTYGEVNHPDGQYDYIGDEDQGMWWDENTTRIWNERGITGKTYIQMLRDMSVDVSSFAKLVLDPNSKEYLMNVDLVQTTEKLIPRVIMAKSSEDFENEWAAMEQELDKIGINQVMAAYQKLYEERANAWSK